MAVEIERKFLVLNDQYKENSPGITCRQGYIYSDRNKSIRVRTMDDQGFLTIKYDSKGISRTEFEYSIPLHDAKKMLDQLCEKPLIEKIRYKIPFDGFTWDVDEFLGANSGLVLAEIELEYEAQPFSKPSWIGREVSGDTRYYNSNLVASPYSSWK